MNKLTIQIDWKIYKPNKELKKIIEYYWIEYMELQPQEEQNFFWEEIVNPERLSVKQETNPDFIKFTTPSVDTVHINVVEKDEPQLKEYYYRDKYWNPIEFEIAKSWQHLSRVHIEKLPEFNYEKTEEEIRDIEFDDIRENRIILNTVWKQVESLTTTLNKVLERFNNQ